MPTLRIDPDDPVVMNEVDPYVAMEAMQPAPRPPRPVPPKRVVDPAAMKRARRRGRNGEYEVVRAFKQRGWPDAFRTPGSGSWRPYGAQDTSPFPLDVASGWPEGWPLDERGPMAGPWMVEVKFDERMGRPGRSGVLGESFIRATAKKAHQQWHQYIDVPGSRPVQPAFFGRASNGHWRVFVPQTTLVNWLVGSTAARAPTDWVEVSYDLFFDELAPFVAHTL